MHAHRPRIAIVRGEALNPFELQAYAPLLADYDVVAVGRRNPPYEVDQIPVPVALLDGVSAHPALSRALRLATRLGAPRVDHSQLRGFEQLLARAEVVHSADTMLTVSDQAAGFATRTAVPLVLTCWENIPFRYDDDPVLAERKSRVRAATSLFLAVTPQARDALIAEGTDPGRITVIPPAVDTTRFTPEARDAGLKQIFGVPDEAPMIVYVGRVIKEKGVVELVRAVGAMRRGSNAHLVVIGNGGDIPRVRVAARALGLSDRVHLVAGQSYRDIPRIFASADVIAVPSLSTPYWTEQFGYVLAEAMACGGAVVTTESGSIPSVVGDAAIVVRDYDVSALAAALDALVGDPARREQLGSRARERAVALYSVDVVAPQLAAAYRSVLPTEPPERRRESGAVGLGSLSSHLG